ncbi:hypothetical protein BOX15_Mlig029584g1 [Macrostomum lignano]|uniref:AA_permease_C domain-containing protein n=1 Tax=Macrostomum lignano TaxID=282301 RepID=A0A267ER63_9PLAT|nr:hypothetical protein BOX15_Mlig029584g1 [Macrostomum lignano]
MGALPAFLVLWITFVAIGAVSNAANSLLFAKYCLSPLFVGCPVPELLTRATAFLSVALLCSINCINVKWATKTAVIISICKVSALILVTVIGFYNLAQGKTENFEYSFSGSDYGVGMISAFYQGFWAFAGWNYLNFLTEEMKRPSRSLPLAIVISLSLITVIYVTANLAYLAVLTPDQLIASHAVAVTFAERTMGPAAFIMPLFVAIAIFGSMNGEVLSMSRAAFTGASEGHFPSALAMVSATRLTPVPSVLFMGICTVVFQQLFTNQLDYLIELTGFAFMSIVLMAIGCLLYLRFKQPQLVRPLKLPIVVPITLFVITLLICIITFVKSPKESILSVVIMLTGLPFYVFGVMWKSKPTKLQQKVDGITYFVQKFLLVLPQEKPFDEQE